MRKEIVVGMALVALTALPTRARADTLSYTGLGPGAWITVSQGGSSITGWAGEIDWNLTAGSTSKAIQTYCADLYDDARLPTQTVTTETTSALDSSITGGSSLSVNALAGAGARIAYLVNTYGGVAHTSADLAAGLQLAIWETEYGLGSFTYSASTAIVNAANNFFNGITTALQNNPSVVLASTATYYDVANNPLITGSSAAGQDQVGVPEPLPILLLMIGMFGLLWSQRRVARRQIES